MSSVYLCLSLCVYISTSIYFLIPNILLIASTTASPPTILYGTAWKRERTYELVLAALRAGFRGIDTACQPKHYDEAAVGAALETSGLRRADLYVQTKYTPLAGQDPDRLPYDAAAEVEEQV